MGLSIVSSFEHKAAEVGEKFSQAKEQVLQFLFTKYPGFFPGPDGEGEEYHLKIKVILVILIEL